MVARTVREETVQQICEFDPPPEKVEIIDSNAQLNGGVTLDADVVDGRYDVDEGELTIDAGSWLYFAEDRGIEVSDEDSLNVAGTQRKPGYLFGETEVSPRIGTGLA